MCGRQEHEGEAREGVAHEGLFVIRNTFICAIADEPLAGRRRAYSESWSLAPEPAAHDAVDSQPCALPAPDDAVSLVEALEAGGDSARAAVAAICGAVPSLAADAQGCRAVALAFEHAGPLQVACMLEELRGSIAWAARSPHASAVLEAAIHVGCAAAASAVAEELVDGGRIAALHAGGCQVVCRLLEYAGSEPRVVGLTDGILAQDVAGLCCHKHGHQVAMSILSNGLTRQRAVVADALFLELKRFSKHRFAAFVLQHALIQLPPPDCCRMAHALMEQSGAVVSLACHSAGVHVVRALLSVPEASKRAQYYITKGQRRLMRDKFGTELLAEVGLDGVPRPGSVPEGGLMGGA